jgi:hypothetical protein
MTDKQRPKIVFHKPPSDSANPHGMPRPIIPLKRNPPANNSPVDMGDNAGYRHDMRDLPLKDRPVLPVQNTAGYRHDMRDLPVHKRPTLPLRKPTTDSDPTPPMGTQRPRLPLNKED